MRAQSAGLVVAISSTAGIVGQEFCSAYAGAKFGVAGWMESLTHEVPPFGIRTMLVEPGFFRTELLTPESTKYAKPSIEDYAERTEQTVTAWSAMNGKQGVDPAKLADALLQIASQDQPPLRFPAGADAVATLEQKTNGLLAQADALLDCQGHPISYFLPYLMGSEHGVQPAPYQSNKALAETGGPVLNLALMVYRRD
jgi:NAD(P)-dependent dehydrogenase (short-subunit alcohol dehydrogenase family)